MGVIYWYLHFLFLQTLYHVHDIVTILLYVGSCIVLAVLALLLPIETKGRSLKVCCYLSCQCSSYEVMTVLFFCRTLRIEQIFISCVFFFNQKINYCKNFYNLLYNIFLSNFFLLITMWAWLNLLGGAGCLVGQSDNNEGSAARSEPAS